MNFYLTKHSILLVILSFSVRFCFSQSEETSLPLSMALTKEEALQRLHFLTEDGEELLKNIEKVLVYRKASLSAQEREYYIHLLNMVKDSYLKQYGSRTFLFPSRIMTGLTILFGLTTIFSKYIAEKEQKKWSLWKLPSKYTYFTNIATNQLSWFITCLIITISLKIERYYALQPFVSKKEALIEKIDSIIQLLKQN